MNGTVWTVSSLAFTSGAVSESFFTYEITRLAVVFKSDSVKPSGHLSSGFSPFGSTGLSFSWGVDEGTSTILGFTTILNVWEGADEPSVGLTSSLSSKIGWWLSWVLYSSLSTS